MRLLVALCMLLCLHVAAHADIMVTTEEYPPFNTMIDGKVAGISTDLVQAIFNEAQVPYTIRMYPWERAYTMALQDKDTCVYNTAQTDERKPLFEWVGPLAQNDWTLFGLANRHLDIKTLEDARSYRIGGYHGAGIVDYLVKQGFQVDAAPHDYLNIPKLLRSRIDLWATGAQAEPYLAGDANVRGIVPLLTFKQVITSLACNKGTDPVVLAKLRHALGVIRSRTGTQDASVPGALGP